MISSPKDQIPTLGNYVGRLPYSPLNDSAWLSFVICFSRQTGRRQSTSPPCLGAACVWIWRWQVRVRQIRNSTVCIWCAIVHCSMRISAMRPQPMGYRHRWDHFSPRCPILKDLKDGLEDVGHIGQFRKWKWYLSQISIKTCLLILQGINFFLQNR